MAGVLVGVFLRTPAGQVLSGQLRPGRGHQLGIELRRRPIELIGMPLVGDDLALGRSERRRMTGC